MKHDCMPPCAPQWLHLFVDQVLEGLLEATLIGCHYFQNVPANEWEVSLFELPEEIYGGAADGMQVSSRLRVDLAAITSAFDSLSNIWWQAERISEDDELGNHLSFEGTAGGFRIWLRILRNVPPELSAGRSGHARDEFTEDSW
jgi:hypothetical protein